MDYLDILRNDAKLAEDFDTLFDFRLLGSIGYWSSEGAAGRLAESMDDLFHLIVFSICWHDYCDSSKYADVATLEEYGQNKQLDIISYSPMELWEPIMKVAV